MLKSELHKGDCLEIMPTLKAGSIDFILTDPPYGTTACKWDSVIPFEPMWECIWHVAKPNAAIALFGSEPFSSALRMSQIKRFKYDWVWSKSNPSGISNAKKMPLRYHENISVYYRKLPFYNPQKIPRTSRRIEQSHKTDYFFKTNHGSENDQCFVGLGKHSKNYDANYKMPSTILNFNSLRANSKEWNNHPTQKPVALLEYLIKTYTNEGDTVLDFTMGSGSTGVACKNLNRNFIGIEKDEKYFEIAKNRIENVEE